MIKTLISHELHEYANWHSLDEHPILQEIRLYTEQLSNSRMQITPIQAKFMGLLAKIMGAKHYLEIGVFTGYSTLAMTLAMPQNAEIYALELNPEYVDIATKFWEKAGILPKIHIKQGNATETLIELHKEKSLNNFFDIAFIDADKSSYPTYYEYCLKLVRAGGLILIDNTFMHGQVLEEDPIKYVKVIKELNDFIKNDERVVVTMLPIADGLTLAYKK